MDSVLCGFSMEELARAIINLNISKLRQLLENIGGAMPTNLLGETILHFIAQIDTRVETPLIQIHETLGPEMMKKMLSLRDINGDNPFDIAQNCGNIATKESFQRYAQLS